MTTSSLPEKIARAIMIQIEEDRLIVLSNLMITIERELEGGSKKIYTDRSQVQDACKNVEKENPDLEFASWIDHCTDNILLKAYHIEKRYSLGCAVTRRMREDSENLTKAATNQWIGLAAAMRDDPSKYGVILGETEGMEMPIIKSIQ